jgi:hypothetical protein
LMDKHLSIVLVDKRHHRKIAQDNWGLTDEQMKGMHVHHRVPRSKKGTNDASNLYVCSSWFHKHVWHNGEEWIDWANKGGQAGAESCRQKRLNNPEWAKKESERASAAAKKMHKDGQGTPEYSQSQRVKSIKAVASKRSHWSPEEYNFVWSCHTKGMTSGYRIAKLRGVTAWKSYSNMLECAILGLTFEQATVSENYVEERLRLIDSPIANILSCYGDL